MNPQADTFTQGDIIPGERVGAFALGLEWETLRCLLPPNAPIETRHDSFVVTLPNIWFFVNKTSKILTQITVLDGFEGALGKHIRVGSTVNDLSDQYGRWSIEAADASITCKGLAGICFDLAYPVSEGDRIDSDEPIAFISVYRPS